MCLIKRVPRKWERARNRPDLYGSPDRTRTCDLMINSHPLYRLSYRGMLRILNAFTELVKYSNKKLSSWVYWLLITWDNFLLARKLGESNGSDGR